MPSVSSGTSVPVAAALLAASGPATPSIAPRPNSSGRRDRRFSSAYDRKVGISAPPAGMVPNGKPMAVPRSHAGHERRQSSAVMRGVCAAIGRACSSRSNTTACSASATANSATATSTTSMPSASAGSPKVKRTCPEIWSMPTMPSASPSASDDSPRKSDAPSSEATAANASTASAKYSTGPNASAHCTTRGANSDSSTVAMVPATNEPIAAVASAGPARPRRAIWLPSRAVTRVADSPGVLSRMDVVEPPNIAP